MFQKGSPFSAPSPPAPCFLAHLIPTDMATIAILGLEAGLDNSFLTVVFVKPPHMTVGFMHNISRCW